MSTALAQFHALDHRDDEALAASEWALLLDVTPQAFRKAGVPECSERGVNSGGQLVAVYRFGDLPERWRSMLTTARQAHGVALHRDLLDIAERAGAWQPPKRFAELPAATRDKAKKVHAVMLAYFGWLEQGKDKGEANLLAQAEWLKQFGKPCSERTIRRWEDRLMERGAKYLPVSRLRLEAFAEGRSVEHNKARRDYPPDFAAWFRAQFLDPRKGMPTMGAIYAQCCAAWEAGADIPGLGQRGHEGEAFPFTKRQLAPLMPRRDAREVAGKGKFLAKTGGYLAALPLDWSEVEPCRYIQFDDKQLDLQILTDDGTRSFRPIVYIAYCAGTRRILAFIVREEGRMTQLDVEGLQAAVLREHGMGGPLAGWPTILKLERGTIAISGARQEFMETLFAGHIEFHRTAMIGGKNIGGDFAQAPSGNFYGKGAIESLMAAIDIYGKVHPGATGNRYGNQPAQLGDTTLTLEKLINSARQGRTSPRSLLEEGVATAALARILEWHETGECVSALEACARQGIRPPTLFYSDFVVLLGELFRAHNHRRGHRMQGFATVRVPHPDPAIAATGRVLEITESPMDKAARLLARMELAGRRLVRPHEADIAALLHKVKFVRVTANGVLTEGRRYWSPDSAAIAAATSIDGGARVYLALYNPVEPDALYLLKNPPSHLAANTTEIPEGFTPQLAEILPLYRSASPVDPVAMANRAELVARANARAGRAILAQSGPVLLERTEEREVLRDRMEPLRAAIRSAAPVSTPETLPPSALGRQMLDPELADPTRSAQRDAASKAFQASIEDTALDALNDEY